MNFTLTAQPSEGRVRDLIADNYTEYGTPYHALWAAVILQAIWDITRVTDQTGKYKVHNIVRIQNSARHWLFEHMGSEVGSLNWVCDHIGLDSGEIRRLSYAEIKKADDKTQVRKYHKRKSRGQVQVKKRRRVFHVVDRSTKKWHSSVLPQTTDI